MTRSAQSSRGISALLAAGLLLGGTLWGACRVVWGASAVTLAVVHAASPPPTAGGAPPARLQSRSHAPESQPHRVTLSWHPGQATGTGLEDIVTGYNVYRREATTPRFIKLNGDPILDSTYVDESVRAGESYEYETTAINYRGIESGPSNQVRVRIPYP